MSGPLLATKFNLPPRSADFVSRHELVERLKEGF
jgi:hypothetical protein